MSDKRKQAARQMMKDHPGMTYCGALNQMRRERELQAPAAIDSRPVANGTEGPRLSPEERLGMLDSIDPAHRGPQWQDARDRLTAGRRKPEPMA